MMLGYEVYFTFIEFRILSRIFFLIGVDEIDYFRVVFIFLRVFVVDVSIRFYFDYLLCINIFVNLL